MLSRFRYLFPSFILILLCFSLCGCLPADKREKNDRESIPADKLELSDHTKIMIEGDSVKLDVAAEPANADYTLSSTDETVVKVDENGMVTAVSKGTANVIASAGKIKDYCVITVKALSVSPATMPDPQDEAQPWKSNPKSYRDYWLSNISIKTQLGGENYLKGMSKWEVTRMLNEILARNNFRFTDNEWLTYFSCFDWYTPNEIDGNEVEASFNRIEAENYRFLVSYINKYF